MESDITLLDCQYRSQRSTINYDGSEALCCATYGADKIVAEDFLSTYNAAVIDARYARDYFGTCMGAGCIMFTLAPIPPRSWKKRFAFLVTTTTNISRRRAWSAIQKFRRLKMHFVQSRKSTTSG